MNAKGMKAGKKGDAILKAKKGLLFCTYMLLHGKRKLGKEVISRVDDIAKWCKGGRDDGEFDGLLLFDECHNAKNATGTKATKTGTAVLELQVSDNSAIHHSPLNVL